MLDRRMSVVLPDKEKARERREFGERRTGRERRLSVLSAEDQIRESLRLLTRVVESGITPEEQRGIEKAMLRLRFALDRLDDTG